MAKKTYRKSLSSSTLFSAFILSLLLLATSITVYQINQQQDLQGSAHKQPQKVASLYLNPSRVRVKKGNEFSVQIRENSLSERVNAIQADLSYPPNDLALVRISYEGGVFPLAAQEDTKVGKIEIARGAFQPVIGDRLVAVLTFKKIADQTKIEFTSESAVVSGENSENILEKTFGLRVFSEKTAPQGKDITPPTVVIMTPKEKSVVSANSRVRLSASVDDDTSVRKVEFYVNSKLICSTASVPFACTWKVGPTKNTSYQIQVKAYDHENNSAIEKIVVYTR